MNQEKFISVFDMFKIGVGPSSSHTLGPWKAALQCISELLEQQKLEAVDSLQIKLYGSLAKTGRGHGSDIALLMGLCGEDPVTTDTSLLLQKVDAIKSKGELVLSSQHSIPFVYEHDFIFLKNESLPYHPNALQIIFHFSDQTISTNTYYSIGGGFIEKELSDFTNTTKENTTKENESTINGKSNGKSIEKLNTSNSQNHPQVDLPFEYRTTEELLHGCMKSGLPIHEIVLENELMFHNAVDINQQMDAIWKVMLDCMYKGCHTPGELPGGLKVQRRAYELNNTLLNNQTTSNLNEWLVLIEKGGHDFKYILDWVSCFALAVNEENASFGRVVTAPTNGAAGVIPAVLLYANLFCDKKDPSHIRQFLYTASAVGMLFKNGATISAAMGGCQAEIGVSSAMAAAGLAELLGGSQRQTLMAAEIAMEHHLGLTCDPVGGLVQIPCIERNTMGAIKAITAAQLALQSKPDFALVSLDKVIQTMWNTALDMNAKYKETADGGLATQISIALAEC